MTTTFSIWQNQIILHWDGFLPGRSPEDFLPAIDDSYKEKLPSGVVQLKPSVQGIRLGAMLKDMNAVLPAWEHIGPYARYNEKCRGYFLAFGKQNLQRIFKQFGQIPVEKGQGRINELKLELHRFQAMLAKMIEIKASPTLPAYDFKVPPLAPYQHREVWFLVEIPSSPVFADCGTGKTFCVLVSTEIQMKKGITPRGKTLICGKLATLHSGWLKDAEKFTDLKVSVLWTGSSYKRKEKILKALEEEADVYLINHDGVRVFKDALAAKRFDKVVVDESTILKSFRGPRAKGGAFGRALMEVAEHARWRVIMSGTPAPNGPEDLWGQYKFLDPHGFILEPSFFDFRSRYMDEIHFGNPDDPNTPSKWVTPPRSNKEIAALIQPTAYRVKLRDHLQELPPLTVMKRELPMSPVQAQHYKEMLKAMATEIDDEFVSVTIKLAQIQKLRQLTGGFLIDELEAPHPIDDNPKLEMMDDLLFDEIDVKEHKVIIFAQHQWEIETLVERYKHLGAVSVYGGNTGAAKVANIQKFLEDETTRVIVLHPKSAGHGVTLTNAHYMIFYSVSYSAEEDYQSVKRIERAGQKEAMFVYYLLCQDTIDGVIYDVVQAKHASQSELIDTREVDEKTVHEVWRRLREQMSQYSRRGKRHEPATADTAI